MFCPKCGAQVSDTAQYCNKCGNQLIYSAPAPQPQPTALPARFCNQCGNTLSETAAFCSRCGARTVRFQEPAPAQTPVYRQPVVQPTYIPTPVPTPTWSGPVCPRCGGPMTYQTVTESRKAGCLTVLLYIILALTIFGLLIVIPLALRRKTTTVTYATCQHCGYRQKR